MVPWRKMVKIRKGAKKGQKGKSARKLGKEVKSINILICSTIPYQMGRKLYSQRLPPRPYYIVHGPTPPWALAHARGREKSCKSPALILSTSWYYAGTRLVLLGSLP